ncbi:MAG TPA: helix-turn-helix domain-containing protein [Candidatus Alistipes stercoripullorum]|jgi:transcriptional regulator with XRE-family HTH domain|nr:helix-turn-helix domain-containing protein [Candidatus Alistipes stercoripullorum]
MDFRIKELCKEKGLLFKELAQQLGITDVGLRQSLQGNPTIGTLEKIAVALGVSVPELFAPQPTNTITCPKCGAVLEVKERE